VTPEQALARRTWKALTSAGRDVWKDPGVEDLNKRAGIARTQGDRAESKALYEQARALSDRLEAERLQAVAARPAGEIDAALAARYVEPHAELKPADFHKTAGQELAPRMGQAPATGDSAGADRTYATGWAWTRNVGLILTLEHVGFDDPSEGARALTAWLTKRGCTRLYYDFSVSETGLDEEE
jgi:hypothetical protein